MKKVFSQKTIEQTIELLRQGYTKAQVAQILGVSLYTISQWKFRGKEALQKGKEICILNFLRN